MIRTLLKPVLGTVRRFVETHVFQATQVYAMRAALDDIPEVNATVRVSFGTLTNEHRNALIAAPEHHYNEALARSVENRRYPGEIHTGLSDAGEILFSAWLLQGQMDLNNGNFVPVSARAAFSYRVVTSVCARGARICPAYYAYLRKQLAARGMRTLLCLIATSNVTSIRAHEKAGFKPVGTFWLFSVGGRLVTYVPAALRRRLAEG